MMKKLIFLVGLVLLSATIAVVSGWNAPDQERAKQRAKEVVPLVKNVKKEFPINRRMSLMDAGISLDDVSTVYFLLDSPIIKEREDAYQPVRFAHKRHAALVGDCSTCHHLRPQDPDALETTRCSACHQDSFNPDHPERTGLKAAYHLQCIQCHEKEGKGPVGCKGCHLQNVPDHKKLVDLPEQPGPFAVTAECLRCHNEQGEDMLKSAHWLWRGPSPYTSGHRKDILHGKGTTALNNF